MSGSIVKCDGCGEPGRRRANHPCPDGWFYIESIDRTFSTKAGIYITWACSAQCRDEMWKCGPGPATIDDAGTMRRRAKLETKSEVG